MSDSSARSATTLARVCESAYQLFNKRKYIIPDPLQLVGGVPSIRDREIAGFIASSLALGRVNAIVAAGQWILERIDPPWETITRASAGELARMVEGFRYRFFGPEDLLGLLLGLKAILAEYGSIQECAAESIRETSNQGTGARAIAAVAGVVSAIRRGARGRLDDSILVVHPEKGSACKRTLLFLRWLVRCDEVDPGGWSVLSPADLIIPVDTHMLAVARNLGLTARKNASLQAAIEITRAFALIAPLDPVRFDFSLTRLGIHPEIHLNVRDIENLLPQTPGFEVH